MKALGLGGSVRIGQFAYHYFLPPSCLAKMERTRIVGLKMQGNSESAFKQLVTDADAAVAAVMGGLPAGSRLVSHQPFRMGASVLSSLVVSPGLTHLMNVAASTAAPRPVSASTAMLSEHIDSGMDILSNFHTIMKGVVNDLDDSRQYIAAPPSLDSDVADFMEKVCRKTSPSGKQASLLGLATHTVDLPVLDGGVAVEAATALSAALATDDIYRGLESIAIPSPTGERETIPWNHIVNHSANLTAVTEAMRGAARYVPKAPLLKCSPQPSCGASTSPTVHKVFFFFPSVFIFNHKFKLSATIRDAITGPEFETLRRECQKIGADLSIAHTKKGTLRVASIAASPMNDSDLLQNWEKLSICLATHARKHVFLLKEQPLPPLNLELEDWRVFAKSACPPMGETAKKLRELLQKNGISGAAFTFSVKPSGAVLTVSAATKTIAERVGDFAKNILPPSLSDVFQIERSLHRTDFTTTLKPQAALAVCVKSFPQIAQNVVVSELQPAQTLISAFTPLPSGFATQLNLREYNTAARKQSSPPAPLGVGVEFHPPALVLTANGFMCLPSHKSECAIFLKKHVSRSIRSKRVACAGLTAEGFFRFIGRWRRLSSENVVVRKAIRMKETVTYFGDYMLVDESLIATDALRATFDAALDGISRSLGPAEEEDASVGCVTFACDAHSSNTLAAHRLEGEEDNLVICGECVRDNLVATVADITTATVDGNFLSSPEPLRVKAMPIGSLSLQPPKFTIPSCRTFIDNDGAELKKQLGRLWWVLHSEARPSHRSIADKSTMEMYEESLRAIAMWMTHSSLASIRYDTQWHVCSAHQCPTPVVSMPSPTRPRAHLACGCVYVWCVHEHSQKSHHRLQNEPCTEEVDDRPYLKDPNHPRCPRCKIPTLRESGCSHMTCNCGCHWCYQCHPSKCFYDNSSMKIYQHIVEHVSYHNDGISDPPHVRELFRKYPFLNPEEKP